MRELVRHDELEAYTCSDCGWVHPCPRPMIEGRVKQDLKAAFHAHECGNYQVFNTSWRRDRFPKAS